MYERHPIKTKDFPLFQRGLRLTNDTVLTVAIADAIAPGRPYTETVRGFGRCYPGGGYGGVSASVRAIIGALLPDDLARVTDIFRERFPWDTAVR